MRCFRSVLLLAAYCLVHCGSAAAHEIPADATIQVFVKPAGAHLQVLVRVPLKTIRDLEFPERADGYLDVEKLAPQLGDAAKVWIADFVEIQEGETRLPNPRIAATQLSLDSDRSFAVLRLPRSITSPGPSSPAAPTSCGTSCCSTYCSSTRSNPIAPASRSGPVSSALPRASSPCSVSFPPGGAVRAYEFTGDPGMVPLDPRWHQAALGFIKLGFFHILDGTDHLLFLLCLVIPLRRLRPLLLVVTAFTVAHSITLIASAYGVAPDALWFPPLIETLIAVSIVYMAFENIVGTSSHRRWMIAFGFGLVHGFGFSFALREKLQFAGSHLATSLLSFNIGVELGQLLVLILLIPALQALFRFVVAERMGTIILSALVAHTGWHWMLERGAILGRFQPPALDAAFLAGALRWLIAS